MFLRPGHQGIFELRKVFQTLNYIAIKFHPKDETSGTTSVTLSSQNKLAMDSSKEEEINAICVQRNFGPNPTDAQKLKALDEEYHYLVSGSQNVKAEQIQLLYQFKAKKISSVTNF